jgi:hypothetical protein
VIQNFTKGENMISIEDLNEIEQNVIKVHALISTVRDSCSCNNYSNEELTLNMAIDLQDKIIEKVFKSDD